MSARRALVTGITGQDGSLLAELLASTGREVVGMVRSPSTPAPASASLVRGDLSDPAGLRRLLADVGPDELFHLAAPTFVPASWEDPAATMTQIAGGTATLLAAAADTGMRVFVASSSEVFGDAGESPQHEDSPMRPRSPYGVAKLAAHRLVGTYRARGLHASSGILFNHESPRRPERFLPRKVARGAAAIALELQDELSLGSLDAVRDWSAARDIVRGALLAVEHDEPTDFVLATGSGTTVREFVETAFEHAGLTWTDHVRHDPSLERPAEVDQLIGDPTKAKELLGWEPKTSFEELIRLMTRADLELLKP